MGEIVTVQQGRVRTLPLLVGVAELADALDLGSSAVKRVGSNPIADTRLANVGRVSKVTP